MSNSHLSMATQKMSVDFLDRFHASRRAKLRFVLERLVNRQNAFSEVLDMELWKSGEVDDVCQRMVDNWTESGVLRVKDAKSTDQHPTKQSIVVNGEHFVVARFGLSSSFNRFLVSSIDHNILRLYNINRNNVIF